MDEGVQSESSPLSQVVVVIVVDVGDCVLAWYTAIITSTQFTDELKNDHERKSGAKEVKNLRKNLSEDAKQVKKGRKDLVEETDTEGDDDKVILGRDTDSGSEFDEERDAQSQIRQEDLEEGTWVAVNYYDQDKLLVLMILSIQ
ncbi:hypothetical protein QE152_g27493 [Popillia japonica]|uniref:Uncharacterized protein n=1 Tax=Popillia japonica TaxID=7064 RepID=A0AAW1JVB4_POPJA